MLPIKRTPQAYQDISDIALYIANDNPDAALSFLDAAEETFAMLSRSPYIGSLLLNPPVELTGFRVRTIVRFRNYLVYYQPQNDCVLVARVVHGAREQDVIQKEL